MCHTARYVSSRPTNRLRAVNESTLPQEGLSAEIIPLFPDRIADPVPRPATVTVTAPVAVKAKPMGRAKTVHAPILVMEGPRPIKRRRAVYAAALALALVGLSGGLAAADDAAEIASAFAKVDQNRDGVIDLAEIRTVASERFVRADLNKDNRLTLDEVGPEFEIRFDLADSNGSRDLGFEEFMRAHVSGFEATRAGTGFSRRWLSD